MTLINIVVEGESDREAAVAVVRAAGHTVNKTVVRGGKTKLDPMIKNYNQAAKQTPWVVFRDTDSVCPVKLRERLLTGIETISPLFHLRLAHSMTEAWLLSDAEGFSKFFQVAKGKLPPDPEQLPHAKQELLRLCGISRSRSIKAGMTAGQSETGPLFVSILNDFARDHWNVEAALENSVSLKRTVLRLSASNSVSLKRTVLRLSAI